MHAPKAASSAPSALRPGLALALLLASLGVACAESPAPRSPRSLLLLTVDTLRADRLGAYGSERDLTPQLDELARRGIVFERAYASAPFTLPSIATILTGRYPDEMGIVSNRSAIPESVPTLASALRARGWRTAAVVSNFVLRDKTGLAEGFGVYDDTMDQKEAVRKWPERVAAPTTDAALRILEEWDASDASQESDPIPWFLWVHYQDPHGPYTPPERERGKLITEERRAPGGDRILPQAPDHGGLGSIPAYQLLDDRHDVAFYRAGYHGEIRYTDREIGRLLAGLERLGLGEQTAIVFTADHGESLGERDYWFAHGEFLGDEQVRVPLLVHVPGLSPARREDLVSLADLFPTLSTLLLGEPVGPEYAGRDLLAPGAEREASVPYMVNLAAGTESRIGMVDGDYKLVLSFRDGLWQAELYRDGNEDVDLAAPAPQITSRMRERLTDLRKRYKRDVAERRQELSEREEAQLRALGYLDEH